MHLEWAFILVGSSCSTGKFPYRYLVSTSLRSFQMVSPLLFFVLTTRGLVKNTGATRALANFFKKKNG